MSRLSAFISDISKRYFIDINDSNIPTSAPLNEPSFQKNQTSQTVLIRNLKQLKKCLEIDLIKDEALFLQNTVQYLPEIKKTFVFTHYYLEWKKAFDAEPLEHKKQNAGRFAANSWLRKNFSQSIKK